MTEPAKTYTAEELKQFDGKEGRRSLVAFKGLVYDVTDSKLWRNGVHVRKHHAGHDLTAEMGPAPHEADVMDSFEIVGRLAVEPVIEEAPVPWLWDYSNRRHLHPVSVHYPIALGMVASLLQAVSLFTDAPLAGQLRFAAFINLLISTIFTFPAVITGLSSWWYDYNATWAWPYLQKNVLSLLLVLVSCTAVGIWFAAPLTPGIAEGMLFWTYSILVFVKTPIVLGLGYYGGRISFPD